MTILNQLGLMLASILDALLHTGHVTWTEPRQIAEAVPANLGGGAG